MRTDPKAAKNPEDVNRPFHGNLEPPPWIYVRLARGWLLRRIYHRFSNDLAGSLAAGARVLDVGTGPGYLLGQLARQRPDLRLCGLDLSYKMLHLSRRKRSESHRPGPANWLVADAARLPFSSGVFHQVITTFSLHTWLRPVTGVAEILRVLKPGARAWIYEMNREAPNRELRQWAGEERIPFSLAWLGFRALSRHHALRARDFAAILTAAGAPRWELEPAHHLFWRAELSPTA